MNNELDCEVVQDLITNYIEELTSEHTNELMKSHLDKCDECRRIYELLTKSEIEKNLVESNINDAKQLKWYMKKIKLVNLFLGIIITVIVMYGGYVAYEALFTITNYEIKSKDIEVTELYQLEKDIIYFTLKSKEPYFVGSATTSTDNTEGVDLSVGLGRTIVPKKASIEDDKSITIMVNTKNGNIEFYYSDHNEDRTKEILKTLVAELKNDNTIENKEINNIYYIGNNLSLELLPI